MDRPAIESASPQSMTSEVAPLGRRRWWQFSLLSLLLLFVIACLIAGYVGQSRRMEEARREIARRDETIKRLRQELGLEEDLPPAAAKKLRESFPK
jgi:AraC-like DNA-binding protein